MNEDQKEKCRLFDRSGLFMGPDESLASYLENGEKCFQESQHEILPENVQKAFSSFLFVDSSRIPVLFTKQKLYPWEMAVCMNDEEGRSVVRIRPIGKAFAKYQEAILAHEMIHALRAPLFSSSFEEIVAWDISSKMFPGAISSWRLFLGPLFSSCSEVISALVLIWGLSFFFLFTDLPLFVLFMIPLVVLSPFFLRMSLRWRKWKRACSSLESLMKNPYSLLVRLSDDEINWLSSMKKKEALKNIQERAKKEWRWQFFLDEVISYD